MNYNVYILVYLPILRLDPIARVDSDDDGFLVALHVCNLLPFETGTHLPLIGYSDAAWHLWRSDENDNFK